MFTFLSWVIISGFFIVHSSITNLFILPFSKNQEEASHFSSVPFLKLLLKLLRVKIVVEGLENIPKEENFILVSNHQSNLDFAIHLTSIPRKFSFFAKKELLKIPIFGGYIKSMGHFVIDQQNPRVASRQLATAREKLLSGYNLLIFPEGTRSLHGQLLEFKKGAFIIAAQTGIQIIPTYIDGSWKVASKGSWAIKPGTITLKIGKPIQVEKTEKRYEKELAEELANKARKEILILGKKENEG